MDKVLQREVTKKGRNEAGNGGLQTQNNTGNAKKQETLWCRIENISAKIDYLVRDNEQMKEKIKYYEDKQRKKNLIFFGVEEEGYEYEMDTYETVCNVCDKIFGIDVRAGHIEQTYRIGKGRFRPILISFVSTRTREIILRNLRKLRMTKIRVEKDVDYETRRRRNALLPFMKAARNKGHFAKIYEDKLKVNGRYYDLEFCEKNINHPEFGLNNMAEKHQRQTDKHAQRESKAGVEKEIKRTEQRTSKENIGASREYEKHAAKNVDSAVGTTRRHTQKEDIEPGSIKLITKLNSTKLADKKYTSKKSGIKATALKKYTNDKIKKGLGCVMMNESSEEGGATDGYESCERIKEVRRREEKKMSPGFGIIGESSKGNTGNIRKVVFTSAGPSANYESDCREEKKEVENTTDNESDEDQTTAILKFFEREVNKIREDVGEACIKIQRVMG